MGKPEVTFLPCDFNTFSLLKAVLLEQLHLVVVLRGGGDDEAAVFVLHTVDAAGDHVLFEADLLGKCHDFVLWQFVAQPVGVHAFRQCDGHALVHALDGAVCFGGQ